MKLNATYVPMTNHKVFVAVEADNIDAVREFAGPKGKWNPDRTAVRRGHEDGGRWPARAGGAAARLARASAIVRRPRIPSVRESAVL